MSRFDVYTGENCERNLVMKKVLLATAIAGMATLFSLGNASTARADSFAFSFNTGDVALAYSDGYWDHDHNWHRWHNAREAREYRVQFRDHYYSHPHHHYRNNGWRDSDHDGVPNRFDDHPHNPHRD
jgi:hypothetical protein